MNGMEFTQNGIGVRVKPGERVAYALAAGALAALAIVVITLGFGRSEPWIVGGAVAGMAVGAQAFWMVLGVRSEREGAGSMREGGVDENGASALTREPGSPQVVVAGRKDGPMDMDQNGRAVCGLFTELPDPAWFTETSGERRWFNRNWHSFTGRPLKADGGVRWEDAVHEDDLARYLATIRSAHDAHAAFFVEYRLQHADGTYRWMSEHGGAYHDPTGAFAGMVASAHDVTLKKGSETALHHALREKESLLKEVHHRVKNNLQIVSSLLNLQLHTLADPAIRSALSESRNRIRSMALIHEQLYQGESFATINMAIYLRNLVETIRRSYLEGQTGIGMEVWSDEVTLGLDTAIPLGLIINELVTNAAKYAFPGTGEGTITVVLMRVDMQRLRLTVSDDGIGLPAAVDLTKPASVGLGLVIALVDQLDGTLQHVPGRGTAFDITFSEQVYGTR